MPDALPANAAIISSDCGCHIPQNRSAMRPPTTFQKLKMAGSILPLSAGSSSLKFALFENDVALKPTARGEIENLESSPHFVAHVPTSLRAPGLW